MMAASSSTSEGIQSYYTWNKVGRRERSLAPTWVFAVGGLLFCAAAVGKVSAHLNEDALVAQTPLSIKRIGVGSTTLPVVHRTLSHDGYSVASLAQHEGSSQRPEMKLKSPEQTTPWAFVTIGMVFISVPVAAVAYARRFFTQKLGDATELFSITTSNKYQLVPVRVNDGIVSLQCKNGYTIDMLVNTPNYRVAMISSPSVQHIRFAVFALFERFTEKGVRVVMLAQEEARRSGHNHVGTEQMLLGIVGEGTGLAARMLKSYGLDLKTARREVSALIGRGDDQVGVEIPFTPRAKKVLDGSQQQARNLGHNYIGTEHLLLALLDEEAGTASKVFENLKIDRKQVTQEMIQAIQEENKATPELELAGARTGAAPAKEEKNESILAQFSVNLTEKANEGKLDPLIGRAQELERVIQILGRRTKNNPCLIGEPGVGKTAIAEGLAQMIATGNVPENLQNKQVTQLDLSLLIAGTKFRGEFEERLKKVLDEVRESKNIILVIDEIHTLVGAGAAEGAIDAANIMKPGLARGEFQLIGATTIAEYRKYIEKDAALERRFQPAMVPEPTEDETIAILHGLKAKYEEHHKLKYTEGAIEAAVRLSTQYINDRYLPDKAIDLLDEAGSCRRLVQAKEAATGTLFKLEAQLKKLVQEKAGDLQNHNFEHAAVLRAQIAELEEKIAQEKAENNPAPPPGSLVAEAENLVTAEHIANIVARWTGIPVEKVSKAEGEALLGLEQKLHEKVIGQDEAVSSIARALRRSRVGMKDPKRPIASLFFLGPTGVGKTQLAKALANLYFGNEKAMVRLDMSEFMERHTVSKLIGSPPGYVGYDEGGQLTEVVRKRPYSLLLFDEIEKAHPDVFNMMLQILEDGRLTDSQGRTVSFKNCLVIMTSNVGSQQIVGKGSGRLGFQTSKDDEAEQTYRTMKDSVQESMKASFKPEFLNRIDEIVVFKQLTRGQVGQVADIMLKDVFARLAAQGITLKVSEAFKEKLIGQGWNPTYGARPLRRAINGMLEDALSDCVLRGDVQSGDTITVDVDGSGRVIVVGKHGILSTAAEATLVPAGIA